MNFHLYTGNRLETLADRFLEEVYDRPLSDPFRAETIMVQSPGMAAWLKQHIGSRRPVAANINFPFLNNMISNLLADAPGGDEDRKLFTPEVMTWRIYALLTPANLEGSLKELSSYIRGENAGLKRFQLAGKIAYAFDQYQIYRPELLVLWEKNIFGRDEQWQAELWRMLIQGHVSRAGKLLDFIAAPERFEVPDMERISIFGVSTMPPVFLNFLCKLSEAVPIHFFYMNPCREYWEFLMTDKEKRQRGYEELEEEFSEGGNPLLAAMGRQGREFFSVVMNLPDLIVEDDCFTDFDAATLLGAVQQDILTMTDRALSERMTVRPEDLSIQFHNCHSRMREIEILHDNLLDLIERRGVSPRDIIVMAPDISVYAPYIKAVFEREPEDSPKRLPFSVSDRCFRDSSRIAEAFMNLLKISGSKFKVSQVLDILDASPVHSAFDIKDDDLELVRKWIGETGVRWGIDSAHRKTVDDVEFDQYSWRDGLKRMLMGYAVPAGDAEDDQAIVQGILPYDPIEGQGAELLGHLCCFMEALFELNADLKRPRSATHWAQTLYAVLDRFFLSDNATFRELALIRSSIGELTGAIEAAGYTEDIAPDIILCGIQQCMENESDSEGFLRGRITFCAMQPMRSIPTAVICLLGMNDGEFPRRDSRPGFDVIASKVKVCDRSKRYEDRYLFLEALLSARECFYASYQGMDEKNNSEKAAAVPLCELRDYIENSFVAPSGGSMTAQIEYKHKLQAFNQEYFTGGRLFSYSEHDFQGAAVLQDTPVQQNFMTDDFILEKLENVDVTLDELLRFFSNPCRYFIGDRLHAAVALGREDEIRDVEPFELDYLENYKLDQVIINDLIRRPEPAALFKFVRRGDLLPVGIAGEKLFQSRYRNLQQFADECGLKARLQDADNMPVDIALDGVNISGRLDNVRKDGMIYFRYANFKGKDAYNAWIRHLVFNVASGGNVSTDVLVSKAADKLLRLKPLALDVATERLREIIKLYVYGLTYPLPFFPKTSFAFATASLSSRDKCSLLDKKLKAALTEFSEQHFNATGLLESEDPAVRLCYDSGVLAGEAFMRAAQTVYLPFFRGEGEISVYVEEVPFNA